MPKAEGVCRICGSYGELHFEHVPPKSAFNKDAVRLESLEEQIERGLGTVSKGRVQQRGAGEYTLCPRCNNDTGKWYVPAFADWCMQGADVLIRSGFNPKLIYLHEIYPLRVLKQILVMAFSVNHEWRSSHPELAPFVLNPEKRGIPNNYSVFVYYTHDRTLRRIPDSIFIASLFGESVRRVTEISHFPYGYVITTDGSRPDDRFCEITHFQKYDYDEKEVAPLHLNFLPTVIDLPLDYRTREQIERDYMVNVEAERREREKDPRS